MLKSGISIVFVLVILSALQAACAPGPATRPVDSATPNQAADANTPRGKLRIGWPIEPDNLDPKLISGAAVAEYIWVFNSFLTYYDFSGAPHPMLARQIPTQESGDWIINPDGTMVTTYRLRENLRWQDGAPIRAADFVFAYQVYLDPELTVAHREPEPLMESVTARDDLTVVVVWKRPYIRANHLGYRELNPLPRHLLEEKYRTRRASFDIGADWTSAYVGSGPFRVERWDPGSGIVARAHLGWVFGPPKLDTIEIRFIPDPQTELSNLLAGEVDVINSPGVRSGEVATARAQWVAKGAGYLRTWETNITFLDFQYREVPGWQRALTDIRVRQALLHATDRHGLAEVATDGLGAPADVYVSRSDAIFPEVDRAITKYPFDPARALALMAEAGWRRSDAGQLLTNTAGQTLDMEVRTSGGQAQTGAILADNWKAVGLNSSINVHAPARERDRFYLATFPATQTNSKSTSLEYFNFTSPPPDAGPGVAEQNRGTFRDADVDRFFAIATTSFDESERQRATVGLHKRISEVAGYAPLYYSVQMLLARSGVRGPIGNYGPQLGMTWNIFEWEVP